MAYEDRMDRAEFPYTGAPVVFNLNPGGNIFEGKIIIEATVTIAGGTTNGTVIGDGGPTNLIQRIRVIANKAAPNANGTSRYPDGALVNCSPQTLLRYATIEHQGKYFGELSGSTLGNGAAGVYNIYFSVPIYWADSVLQNNTATALNMNSVDSQGRPIYSAVQVQIEFAQTIQQIFSGNDRTMTVAGFVRWDDTRFALTSDTVPLKQEDHYALIQAAYEEFVDPGMPQDGAFESWLILAQQGSPSLALSDALINRIKLQSGQINFKQNWQAIRQQMFDDGWYDPAQNAVGQFFIDFTNGSLRNTNQAAGLLQQFSVNNPSGAGLDRLRIYTRRVFGLAA
jgi:hypothetical protein